MQKEEKGFITYIVAIAVVLVVVAMSQNTYFMGIGKNIYSKAEAQVSPYWEKASEWAKAKIYPKVSGEVAKKGESIKEEIKKEKENFVKTIWENIKNYFADKFSKATGTEVN